MTAGVAGVAGAAVEGLVISGAPAVVVGAGIAIGVVVVGGGIAYMLIKIGESKKKY